MPGRSFLRIDRAGGAYAATARGRRLTSLGDKGRVSGTTTFLSTTGRPATIIRNG